MNPLRLILILSLLLTVNAVAEGFSTPPAGFDQARPGVAAGKVETIDFTSKSGGRYRASIYLPTGFDRTRKYPVLFLLHGASGDESTWTKDIHLAPILDNLIADKKALPMIVVMPACVPADQRTKGPNPKAAMGFTAVLTDDLLPLIEQKYPLLPGRENRALGGLSMGGGLALGAGLANPDKFAWVGAFSGSGGRREGGSLKVDRITSGQPLKLLWLSVGDTDKLMGEAMASAHRFLTERKVPHVYQVNSGGHEPKVWMADLYHIAPLLFRP